MIAIIVLIAGAGMAAGLVVSSRVRAKNERMLDWVSKVPPTSISNFPDGGRAKVVGSLEYQDKPLVSPLTGRECAYYNITVEEYIGDAETGRWREIIHEELRAHFVIRDSTGAATVDTGAAEISADVCVQLESGTFDDPTEQEAEFLASHGKRGKGWFFNSKLRYREGILEAGEIVSVIGGGVLEPDEEAASEVGTYRGMPPLKLHMSGTYEKPLLISDNPATLS